MASPPVGPSMKPAVALLAFAVLAAGCIAQAPGAAPGPAAPPPSMPTSAGAAPPPAGPADTLAVDAFATSDGSALADAWDCATPAPEGCDLWATINYEVTGTWTGLLIDRVHATVFPDGSFVVAGDQVFTGAIEGCGSGTLTLRYTGAGGEPDPEHPGHVLGYDDLYLVPGSTTVGLAGVTRVEVRELYHINPVTLASEGALAGAVTCRPIPVPSPPNRDGATAHPLQATWTSAGFLGPDQFACVPGRAHPCELHGTLMIDLVGPMAGSMTDIFHFHYLPAPVLGATLQAAGYRLFTGTLGSCGSGSLALRLLGDGVAEPNLLQPGKVHLLEPIMTLVPGSLTTGLASVVDLELTLEFNMTADTHMVGTASGTVWCKPAAPPSTSREGARAIPLQAAIFAPGALYPDAAACGPGQPGGCEAHLTLLVQLDGPMAGNFLDVFHFHGNPDQTITAVAERTFTVAIDGCGSGTFALHLDGTTEPLEPSTAHPGFLHLQEPRMTFVPGSTTTGFAGLVDVDLVGEGVVTGNGYFPTGTVAGTVWCK